MLLFVLTATPGVHRHWGTPQTLNQHIAAFTVHVDSIQSNGPGTSSDDGGDVHDEYRTPLQSALQSLTSCAAQLTELDRV